MTTLLHTIWGMRQRRRALAMAAVPAMTLLLVLGTVIWTARTHSAAGLERDSQIAAWDTSSAQAFEISQLSDNYAMQVRTAAALRDSGFTRNADRVAWVEATLTALKRIHPVSYSVEAKPAQTQPMPDTLQNWYLEHGLEAPAFEVNDLIIEIQGTFEDALLDVLNTSTAAGGALVRTEHCKLVRRPDNTGIDAECRLRRYSLSKAPLEPAA